MYKSANSQPNLNSQPSANNNNCSKTVSIHSHSQLNNPSTSSNTKDVDSSIGEKSQAGKPTRKKWKGLMKKYHHAGVFLRHLILPSTSSSSVTSSSVPSSAGHDRNEQLPFISGIHHRNSPPYSGQNGRLCGSKTADGHVRMMAMTRKLSRSMGSLQIDNYETLTSVGGSTKSPSQRSSFKRSPNSDGSTGAESIKPLHRTMSGGLLVLNLSQLPNVEDDEVDDDGNRQLPKLPKPSPNLPFSRRYSSTSSQRWGQLRFRSARLRPQPTSECPASNDEKRPMVKSNSTQKQMVEIDPHQRRIETSLLRLFATALPSSVQLRRWQDSFDALLSDHDGIKAFREFLRTEFSDENIEFWLSCEEFRLKPDQNSIREEALLIFNEFVAVHARREINLDSCTRLQTEKEIPQATRHIFDQCQLRIKALMEKDSYNRFLRSDLFQTLTRLSSTCNSRYSHRRSSSTSGLANRRRSGSNSTKSIGAN